MKAKVQCPQTFDKDCSPLNMLAKREEIRIKLSSAARGNCVDVTPNSHNGITLILKLLLVTTCT